MDGGSLEILEVLPNSPAHKSRSISPGSRIIAVGQGDDGPLVELAPLNHAQALALTRGAVGSVIRLKVMPPHETNPSKALVVTLKRVKIGSWTQGGWEQFESFFRKREEDTKPVPPLKKR